MPEGREEVREVSGNFQPPVFSGLLEPDWAAPGGSETGEARTM